MHEILETGRIDLDMSKCYRSAELIDYRVFMMTCMINKCYMGDEYVALHKELERK